MNHPTDRPDLYGATHKGLRLFLADTWVRLGRAEPTDAAQPVLDQLAQLLQLHAGQSRTEDDHLHTAIEARRPGLTAPRGAEHRDQAEQRQDLQMQARAVALAPTAAGLRRLYRQLSRFAGQVLLHMRAEEDHHNPALHELLDDEALRALHRRQLAALAPAQRELLLRWTLAAVSADEAAALLCCVDAPTRERLQAATPWRGVERPTRR